MLGPSLPYFVRCAERPTPAPRSHGQVTTQGNQQPEKVFLEASEVCSQQLPHSDVGSFPAHPSFFTFVFSHSVQLQHEGEQERAQDGHWCRPERIRLFSAPRLTLGRAAGLSFMSARVWKLGLVRGWKEHGRRQRAAPRRAVWRRWPAGGRRSTRGDTPLHPLALC